MMVTVSKVHNRLACAMTLRKAAINKDTGIITNVKLTRVGFMVWHLQFDMEIKR